MPFVSNAQRKYLWSQKPEVAREFADKSEKHKKLPEHVAKKRALKRLVKK